MNLPTIPSRMTARYLQSRRWRMSSIGLAALLLSCGSSITIVNRDLENAKARWTANAPLSYDLTVEKGCYCVFEAQGPVVVAVRNGVVESRHYVETGAVVGASYADVYPTVDQLFAIIEEAVGRKADRVEVLYEPTRGYPTSVAIDVLFSGADDEYFYSVTGFTVK